MDNPIEELFSDSGPIDINAVVNSLKPFLRIHRPGNDIFFTELGNKANVNTRILLYGLAKKLLKLEDLIKEESFSAKEVFSQLAIKKGSIDAGFSALKKLGYILGSEYNYSIPNYKVSNILDLLAKKEKEAK